MAQSPSCSCPIFLRKFLKPTFGVAIILVWFSLWMPKVFCLFEWNSNYEARKVSIIVWITLSNCSRADIDELGRLKRIDIVSPHIFVHHFATNRNSNEKGVPIPRIACPFRVSTWNKYSSTRQYLWVLRSKRNNLKKRDVLYVRNWCKLRRTQSSEWEYNYIGVNIWKKL